MSASMRAMADELGVPLGIVLEGGYDLGALARSVVITLDTVGAEEAPSPPEAVLHSLAAAARERLVRGHWPSLA
jgi:acetoin utilization deacetylase AcuC-like enzyme